MLNHKNTIHQDSRKPSIARLSVINKFRFIELTEY
jgi:hypothetical protein